MRIESLCLIPLCVVVSCTAAAAHPRCDDMGFALVHGQWIESQWCEEELAAQVEGKRRWGHTAAELHSSAAAMDDFCRSNFDIRFTTVCAPYKD